MEKVPKLEVTGTQSAKYSDYPIQISEWNKTAHRSL